MMVQTTSRRLSNTLKLGLTTLFSIASVSAHAAEAYPTRPISIIVPFATGGGVDIIARVLAEKLDKKLGQRVIIENVPGATGTIGAARVARAAPDGYTILFNNISQATVNTFGENVPYNALTDFAPIGSIANMPMLLVTRKGIEGDDAKQKIAAIKKTPKDFTVATNGVGSTTHLCQAQFQKSAGAAGMIEVPYKGTGPALIDLAGGAVDVSCDTMLGAAALIDSGKIEPLAVASPQRFAQLPNVPTFAELGIEDMDVSVWFAAFGPKDLPAPIVEKLAATLREAIQDPDVLTRLDKLNAQPEPAAAITPQALAQRMRTEAARWADLAPKVNVAR